MSKPPCGIPDSAVPFWHSTLPQSISKRLSFKGQEYNTPRNMQQVSTINQLSKEKIISIELQQPQQTIYISIKHCADSITPTESITKCKSIRSRIHTKVNKLLVHENKHFRNNITPFTPKYDRKRNTNEADLWTLDCHPVSKTILKEPIAWPPRTRLTRT